MKILKGLLIDIGSIPLFLILFVVALLYAGIAYFVEIFSNDI